MQRQRQPVTLSCHYEMPFHVMKLRLPLIFQYLQSPSYSRRELRYRRRSCCWVAGHGGLGLVDETNDIIAGVKNSKSVRV